MAEGESDTDDQYWYAHVYQGDKVPQLTWRAVIMGGVLGSFMSISNLYTSIKLGWGFGVAITACVLSYVVWNTLRVLLPRLTPMSILENNCMQSTASAAGYSTGATVGTAFGALLLITGHHVPWPVLLAWTIVTACLGVFLAVPMKRQMIDREQLRFPSGIAAAATLKSLHAESSQAISQAKALVVMLFTGMLVGFLGKGEFVWQKHLGLKIPEIVPFKIKLHGIACGSMPLFGFEPSVLLIGAGMLVGMRVSLSMFAGSLLLYLFVGPAMIHTGEITSPEKLIKGWSLWTGTAIMVTSGLTAFAWRWKTIARSFSSIKYGAKEFGGANALAHIEVPLSWLIIGIIPLTIVMVILQYVAFSINIFAGFIAVILSFFLSMVACRATGETDITPIGPMGKIAQLTAALTQRADIQANLMAGSVTANIASSSADLLTDLKSGYLLGANPRQQFLAQFIGVFFGAASIVPAWYLMVPNRQVMDSFNPPSANMWRAVAEALSHGITTIPYLARWGMLVGGLLGIILAIADVTASDRAKKFLPSAMGLGLAWVVPFANCFSFFIGASIVFLWSKFWKSSADLYVVPVASGAVAGESLICAVIAMINAGRALGS